VFNAKRDVGALRQDLLCAYLVLRELHEYGPHYSENAREEIVSKALTALRSAWTDTGADETEMEPQMLALLASGRICKARPKGVAAE
jgi:hypothetical protein